MKKNIIGYVEPKKIVEVVAAVEEKKLEDFFASIESYNFEDGYILPVSESAIFVNSCDSKINDVEVSDYRPSHVDNKLQTSNDIRDTLRAISEQVVINFKPLTELLESNSKMNNHKTVMILKKFMDLYVFEKKCIYEEYKFSSIQRAIMTYGGKNDIDNFNALACSLVNNTKFLRKIGKKTLLKEFTDNMIFLDAIDKKLVK